MPPSITPPTPRPQQPATSTPAPAQPAPKNLQLDGYQVGELFARVVMDVRRSMPPGVTGAIDVQLEFSSLKVSEKGFAVVWMDKATNESSMSIKLATRIQPDDLRGAQ